MFDFSFYELVVFGIIALIVLGPEKLPQAVRTLGTYYAKFRRTVGTLKAEMEAELDLAETRQQMQEELAKIRQTEAQMKRQMEQLRGSMQQYEHQQNSHLQQTLSTPSVTESTDTHAADKDWVHPVTNSDSTVNPDPSLTQIQTSDAQAKASNDLATDSPRLQAEAESLKHSPDSSLSPHSTGSADLPINSVPEPIMTRPWENMWFLLGDYDRVRRLPPAPLLPNYRANVLLYNLAQSSTASADNTVSADNIGTGTVSRHGIDS